VMGGRRRRFATLSSLLARFGGGGPVDDPGGAAAERRTGLFAYTGVSIVIGLGLLAWTSVFIAPWTAIDPGLPGTVMAGPTGGLLLWMLFGLLGSLRVLRIPGGGTLTFHMPFIGAAMILGGPTAGAWVAFLSSIERRELESQPWYGILANHSVLVIAAVLGGLTTQLVGVVAGTHGTGTEVLAAAIAGALVLATVGTAMGVVTLILRDDISARAFLGVLAGNLGRVTALEMALVVILAFAYVQIGWWSPLLVGGFVLLVWDNNPMPPDDDLTSLMSARGFERRLEAGLGVLRRGGSAGATLMSLDLDRFKPVNDQYGHAVGDEVLREVGRRLRLEARRPGDLAGRLGGDEMALFLPGLRDPSVALRRAREVVASISSPIATSVGPVTVGVSVGVLVLESWGGVPSTGTVLRHADEAMYQAKRSGDGPHLHEGD